MQAFQEAPQINAPSIASSSVIVELRIGQWTARKKDKRASAVVTHSNNADSGTANVNKKLLGHSQDLDALQKFTANARNTHYAMTMPWSDLGQRLLATALYDRYHHTMTGLQSEFYRMKDAFMHKYKWMVDDFMAGEQARLGDLFVHDDYPTPASVASKFRFEIDYEFLKEDSEDHRIQVSNEGLETIKANSRDFYERRYNSAMNDIWKRTHKALTNMSQKLATEGEDVRLNKQGSQVFRDSMVENVLDMVDMLSACNVGNDSQMEAMRLQLDESLHGVTADGLRTSASLRAETKTAVDEAIANLPTIDFL